MNRQKLTLAKTYDYCASGAPKIAVVCVHGIATDSSSYTKAFEYWKETKALADVRFVAFDLLGAGKSMTDDGLKYDYEEQLEALHNAITALELDIPLVLVGHSMGTLIVTRYASIYKSEVRELVLFSPPVYTERDFANPLFLKGMEKFRDVVGVKSHDLLESKQFNASMKYIVEDKKNYQVLSELKTPAVLIFGDKDAIIASYNLPGIIKKNPEYLSVIRTNGAHGVSRDKYSKAVKILERIMNDVS